MNSLPNERGLRLALLAFLGTFLLASVISNLYLFLMPGPMGHFTSATFILWLGFLFASVSGILSWLFNNRLERLEKEAGEKKENLL